MNARSLGQTLLVCCMLVLAACTSVGTKAIATATPAMSVFHYRTTGIPRFAAQSCPFSTAGSQFTPGRNLLCGMLTVPEDYQNPTGRTIQLALAYFKTPHTPALPEPVVYINGGPGIPSIQIFAPAQVAGRNDLFATFGRHDVILLDLRGMGYSSPSLACSELASLVDADLTPEQYNQLQNIALRACYARLTQAGIKTSAYGTSNDARDLDALAQTFALPPMDLYGISYGTRIAQEMLRMFPQDVRSAVLDSVVPPQLPLLANTPSAEMQGLQAFLQGCSTDAKCHAAYPQLGLTLSKLLNALASHPLAIHIPDPSTHLKPLIHIDASAFMSLVFALLPTPTSRSQLLDLIVQSSQGNELNLAQEYGYFILNGANYASVGVYLSTVCPDDFSAETSQSLMQAAQVYPASIAHEQEMGLEGFLESCQAWHAQASDTSRQPITSAIPTLILEGREDIITPPAYGMLVGQSLSQHYFVLLPGLGHGILNGDACPMQITATFLAAPTTPPDTSCTQQMTEPPYLP